MLQPFVYFDHAATTKLYPEVLDFLNHDFAHAFANPSSSHKLGKDLSDKLLDIKKYFLSTLKASLEDEFIFTSSATESNNTIISGLGLKAGDVVLYSKADHPSVVFPIENLKENGVEVIPLTHLNNGEIDYSSIDKVLSEKQISLAVFTLVNHQSGNINDVKKLAGIVKQYSSKTHIHIDAVQAFGKVETLVTNDIDSMSITAHKIGGPKGIAGLYLKKNHKVKPFLLGGGQQSNFRAGTENFPLAHGFSKASEVSLLNLEKNFEYIFALNKKVKESIKSNIRKAIFPFENTSPYILTFIIPGISSDVILRHLEVKNIFIGTTSACSTRIKAYNPTLAALQLPEKFHKNVLRISFGATSNQADTDLLMNEFNAIWADLRFLVK